MIENNVRFTLLQGALVAPILMFLFSIAQIFIYMLSRKLAVPPMTDPIFSDAITL